MASTPLPRVPEVAQFFARVLQATRKGNIRWEATDDAAVVTAKLDGDYLVRLKQVDDFEGESPADADHVLEVVNEGRNAFSVDRRMIDADALSSELHESVEYVFPLFVELWNRATLMSMAGGEHLKRVNALLEAKIK
jgi:hypothetical protein